MQRGCPVFPSGHLHQCQGEASEAVSTLWETLIHQILSTSWVPGPGSTAMTEAVWSLWTQDRVILWGETGCPGYCAGVEQQRWLPNTGCQEHP